MASMLLVCAAVGSAAAQSWLPPWTSSDFPRWPKSVHVQLGDQPVLRAPRADAARRGSVSREAKLPLYAAVRGPGCRGHWLQVGPESWLCADAVALSGEAALPPGPGEWASGSLTLPMPTVTEDCGRANPSALTRCPLFGVDRSADGLPFRYFFVGPDGSLAYRRIEQVDVDEPEMTLERGFGVAIVEQREVGRERYGRTNRGSWVPMRDLAAARPIAFRGSEVAELRDGKIPFAWVVVDRAPVYARQGRLFVPTGAARTRFERVAILEQANSFQGGYARIDERAWIANKSVRHPTLAPAPSEVNVAGGQRWLDIELASQSLVAYEGARPVFATLVSTGRGSGPRSPTATPVGVHRIWVKLLSADMDNLEDESASRYYRIEDVPWVQYFAKGVGLHAAFWHRSFGHVKSHGCVNLAPLDAERLFWWTTPRLPNGWTAVLPASFDQGTVVRVR